MSRACPIVTVLVLLAVSAAFAYVDVPTPEVALHDELPGTLSYALGASAFGAPDGRLAIVAQVDFELRARWSNDRGTTYEPEQVIAGGAGRADVVGYVATRSGDALYAAVFAGDAQGSTTLQVVASDDLGRSWREPVTAATRALLGTPLYYKPEACAIAARGSRVAVLFATERYQGYRVVSSTDGGRTWTAPVRIDPVFSSLAGSSYCSMGLAIDRTGVIHAAYLQYRSGRSYEEVQVTRSIDGGLTFEAGRNVGALLHPSSARRQVSTAIAVADDDGVLVACFESTQALVLRSTDHGATWPSAGATVSMPGYAYSPRFFPSESTGTVLLAATDRSAGGLYGRFVVTRSADHGATFAAPVTLASKAHAYQFAFDVVRTPAGSWVAAWSDGTGHVSDYWDTVQARTSGDDGATWATARRVDSGGGFAQLVGPAIATTNPDEVALAWADGTSDDGRSREVRTNRAAASAVFGPDAGVPLARRAARVGGRYSVVAASGQRAGVLLAAVTRGGVAQLFYRGSADGGRTFGAPVSVVSPGAQGNFWPVALLLRADGRLVALYISGTQLLAVRSLDSGATWSTPFPLGNAYIAPLPEFDDVQLVEGAAGLVHVAWVDADGTIKTARSTDDGLTYTTTVVEADTSPYWYTPAMCRTADRLVLTYAAYYDDAVYGRTSTDGGVTWSDPVQLNVYIDLYWYFTRVVSVGGPTALAVWGDSAGVRANRWDGTAWSGPQLLSSSGGPTYAEHLRVTVPTPGTVLVAWDTELSSMDRTEAVYVVRSTDGGITFGAPQRLDDVAPDPPSISQDVRLESDGQGRAWAIWQESSADLATPIVVRSSFDAGLTWGPLYRLDREPLGGRHSAYLTEHPFAASQGTLFGAYYGQRASVLDENLFNVYDTSDFDRDGVPAANDCSELDPGAWAVPPEVSGLTVQPTQLLWSSVGAASGSGTVYDLVDGSAAQLRTGAFDGAACLASAHAGTTLLDEAVPAPGDARYVLVRGHNACGRGTWGHSTLVPDARTALDAAPCP